jgi:hypothetical protein
MATCVPPPRLVRGALLLALALPAWVGAVPVPTGVPFRVDSYPASSVRRPEVATDGAGNFVVAWSSLGSPGTDYGPFSFLSIQARRFSSAGTPLGAQFQVNTSTLFSQFNAEVAADVAGNFVVRWETYPGAPYAQWYDSAGARQGTEVGFLGGGSGGGVGVDGVGNAVLVWSSSATAGSDTDGYSIQAQRYDATRTPIAPQFQVNTYTTSHQSYPSVAVEPGGEFLIVWHSNGSAGSDASGSSIQAQRYDATGTAVGTELQVNSYTTGNQSLPAVAVDGAGNFTVVWVSNGSTGTDDSPSSSIQARRYDASGTPLGGEFQVNTYTTGSQRAPDVAADAGGNVLVVWMSDGSAGSDTGGTSIQAQGYDGNGLPNGFEFQVNTSTTNNQQEPAVAAQGVGAFVVTWADEPGIQALRIIEGVPTTSTSSTTTSTIAHLLPGNVAIIRPYRIAKFVARPPTGTAFTLPVVDPITVGGTLRIFDTTPSGLRDQTFPLPTGETPPLGWHGLGSPPGSKGYRFKGDFGYVAAVVKKKVVKGIVVFPRVGFATPFTGDIGIVLKLGETEVYCALFGGEDSRNDASGTVRRNAPAPAACP